MPTKKKSSPSGRSRGLAKSRARAAGSRIRETWRATVGALTSAEQEAEKQLRQLLARKGIKPADVRAALASFRARVQKERRKAARQLGTRFSALQVRLRHEGKHLGRVMDETVRGTLVALNVPSRREVAELTRKVDELSRKIDGFRRASGRPRSTRRVNRASATPASSSAQ
jgi:poly(hydroxyalkanoate) granule-associated protein